ncbi:MAG: hypothetical protein WBG62_16070, partial [Cyclobacteriaceae bacterium]
AVDMRHNIRGWLTALNDASLDSVQSNALKDVFGFELRYNEQEVGLSNEARYNGNISAIVWKANNELSDNQPKRTRSYTFAYDDMGRLLSADFRGYENGAWGAEADAYDVNGLTYDANGSIESLTRYVLENYTKRLRMELPVSKAYGQWLTLLAGEAFKLRYEDDGSLAFKTFKLSAGDAGYDRVSLKYSYFAEYNQTKDRYDTSVPLDSYNCAGLALRNYRHMQINEVLYIVNKNQIQYGEAGDIVIYMWIFDSTVKTADGLTLESTIDDFQMVGGRITEDGSEPKNTYSKNGFRKVYGPRPIDSWKVLPEEPATYNDPEEAKQIVNGKQNIFYRENIKFYKIILPYAEY